MTDRPTQTAAYWGAGFNIEEADLEFLNNLLLEEETPLTTEEMAQAIIRRRVEREAEALKRRRQGAALYLPKDHYVVGQSLVFPVLQFSAGTVVGVRSGRNPDLGSFDVIRVEFGEAAPSREFAAGLEQHKLNVVAAAAQEVEVKAPEAIFAEHGAEIVAKLEARLRASSDIVRIAARWFPRALLVSVGPFHLNLAEAVLDMAGGGPLPTEALLKEVGLPENVNTRLQAFSLNYALQEDPRFDEVGASGEVQWHLNRLEPPEVVFPPRRLENAAPAADRSRLTPPLLAVEREVEDEFAPAPADLPEVEDVTVSVTFPHRRVGTLPLSPALARLFPTAYESPRIRFLFVDGETGNKFPGWVVRAGRYVYGLDEWYKGYDFPVGGLLNVRRGHVPGEVIVRAQTRRPAREWVRTASAGPDGRLIFTMQKKPIGIVYDDLTIVAVDNPVSVDEIWLKSQHTPFERLVADVFRELAKLNPQSAVHAKSLYAAVNVARRSPPGPIFAELVARPYYIHVGDAYWRFDSSLWTD